MSQSVLIAEDEPQLARELAARLQRLLPELQITRITVSRGDAERFRQM